MFAVRLPENIPMKNRPIHENLDTSFVNLSALIKYLRRRQFAGSIRVELSGYEADVVLSEENHLTVREHDRISGRVAEGEEALQRLLIRAREPGGSISVYQKQTLTAQAAESQPQQVPPDSFSAAASKISASNGTKDWPAKTAEAETTATKPATPKPALNLPDFPFKLSNNFESKAKQSNLAPEEWQTFLNLMGELLGTIDRTLAEANLNFGNAFRKTCTEVAPDYPFLHHEKEIFDYKHGRVIMRGQISTAIFVAAILEVTRRIMDKLGANATYAEAYRQTTQKILALLRERKPLYDKFSITSPLEKIIGA